MTPLCHVVKFRNDEMTKVLIKSNAHVNVQDKVRRWEDVSVGRFFYCLLYNRGVCFCRERAERTRFEDGAIPHE